MFATVQETLVTVHQKPSTRKWPTALTLVVFVSMALLGIALKKQYAAPVVYYDENESGQQFCTSVETPQGPKLCSEFKEHQLASFEWRPALTPR